MASISPTKPLVLLSLGLLLLACGATTANSPASNAAQAKKIAELEKRLAALEEKTADLDGITRGVGLILERLDGLGQAGPPRPNPTAVYSVPVDGDPYLGPEHAKVTMVMGYDFYCGYCDKVRPVLGELREVYGKDLKVVFKNFVIHDEVARLPALAACAAHQQGKFPEMFEAIWVQGIRARKELFQEDLDAIARKLKIRMEAFHKDMKGPCQGKVQSDFNALSAVGATGTPAFYINGRFIAGALPIAKYQVIIDQEMQKADAALKSGTALKDYYKGLVEAGKKSL